MDIPPCSSNNVQLSCTVRIAFRQCKANLTSRQANCAATHKRGDHHLRCGVHSRPPSEPFSIVLLKRMSAAVAMASFI